MGIRDTVKEDIVDVSLDTGMIFRSFMNHTVGEADADSVRFGFRCLKGGEPVRLGGTVIGYFIRADGTSVVINGGVVSGDTAYITLPAACFAVEGNFTLAIKLSGSGIVGTMRIIDGTVVDTSVGQIVDPGSVIPDLADLLAVIEDAEAAAETISGFSVTAELISGDDYMIVVETEASE